MVEKELMEGNNPKDQPKYLLVTGSSREDNRLASLELSLSGVSCSFCRGYDDYERMYPWYNGQPVLEEFASGYVVAVGLSQIRDFMSRNKG